MRYISREYLKREMGAYIDYMSRRAMKSAKVFLNTEVNAQMLKSMNFVYVIAAVGAEPLVLNIPGANLSHVITAPHVNDEGVQLGETVAVIGGGISGCEIACCLAREVKNMGHLKGTVLETDDAGS